MSETQDKKPRGRPRIYPINQDIELIRDKVGRPRKYATEEEKRIALKEYNKNYAKNNRDKCIQNLRNYYSENKQRVYARNKEYRDMKKQEIKDKLKRLEELESVIANIIL